MLIEVCLSDLNSAINAVKGGASSIELCVDRGGAGGVTPSGGLMSKVVQKVEAMGRDVLVHVLIRPRGGDFCYSDDEFDIMLRDIETAKQAGAHGVVVGVLTPDGHIDMTRMRQVRQASAPLVLTFHRAFDVLTLNPTDYHEEELAGGGLEGALRQVISLGCDRLLTSGRAEQAASVAGMACLRRLTDLVASIAPPTQLLVVAAAGVSAESCPGLMAATGVQGVHAGSSVTTLCSGGHCHSGDRDVGGVRDFEVHQLVSEQLVHELVGSAGSLQATIGP